MHIVSLFCAPVCVCLLRIYVMCRSSGIVKGIQKAYLLVMVKVTSFIGRPYNGVLRYRDLIILKLLEDGSLNGF